MNIPSFALMAALISGTYVAWADGRVETNGRSYLVASKDIRHEKVSDARLTVLGLTIGLHSLTDVQKALGRAILLQRSEQQPHQICYVSQSDHDETVIVFEAGPLGGWKKITAISMFAKKEQFYAHGLCTKSSKISQNVTTGDHLGLTLGQSEIKKRLGPPSREENGNMIYVYEFTEPDRNTKIQWSVYSTVEAIFVNKRMRELSITRTVSD